MASLSVEHRLSKRGKELRGWEYYWNTIGILWEYYWNSPSSIAECLDVLSDYSQWLTIKPANVHDVYKEGLFFPATAGNK